MDRTNLPLAGWMLLALLPVGCLGHIGDSDDGPGGPNGGPNAKGSAPLDAAPARLHHLSSRQYINTVRDLLRVPEAAPVLVDDEGAAPSMLLTEKLEVAAQYLVAMKAHHKEVPCTVTGAHDDACAKSFIESFGARAFRRPLTAEESSQLFSVYTTVKPTNTFAESIDLVTQVILQAPPLFYVAEEGLPESSLPNGLRRLSGYERATRLSYALWDTMPDDALIEAAKSGALDTAEGLEAQARRMLGDDRARATLRRFLLDEWLELSGARTHVGIKDMVKDPKVFPADSPELRSGMRAEMDNLVDKVFADGGSLRALLTSNDAYINASLSKVYGVTAPTTGSTWVKLDSAQRSGILTRAAFLAVYSNPTVKSPIRRGAHLVKNLLCMPIGDPPPNVSPAPIPADTTAHRSIRQTVAAKTADGVCAGCHGIINNAGFAFEHYDGIGLWEQIEKGKDSSGASFTVDIDWTGELRGTDVQGVLSGAIDMSARLADSRTLKDCLVQKFFVRTFGHAASDQEVGSLNAAKAHFASSDDMKEIVIGLIKSPAFLYVRSPEP